MAVDSGSNAKQTLNINGKKKKFETSQKNDESKSQGNNVPASLAKRNKSPGIRVVGGRIYDSTNGKTCHQCRQKTRDFTAGCKNQKNNKPCPVMFCHKCLLNRYGEKAEEVTSLREWSCPKCRGICNCSICMKKKGCRPTGILINTAKATGYSSVSELLLNGGEQLNCEKATSDAVTSMKNEILVSPKKIGKENSFDGKVDASLPFTVDKDFKKVRKASEKRKAMEEGLEDSDNKARSVGVPKVSGVETTTIKPKKIKLDDPYKINYGTNHDELKETSIHDSKTLKRPRDVMDMKDATLASRTSPRKQNKSSNMSNLEAKPNVGVDLVKQVNRKLCVIKGDPSGISENKKRIEEDTGTSEGNYVMKQQISDSHADISLPTGKELTSVAGVDLCAQDVGNALQFSEFCAVFGKTLDVKKGHAEYVLRDIFHGRTGRRGKFSTAVQFHIHLLSIIKNEQGEDCTGLTLSGKNSWFNMLKEYLSESPGILKAKGLDFFHHVADFALLDASQKLKLLNVLCDEVLGTEKVRNWIEDQNATHAESVKEAKQKLHAAKDEEKSLKQKLKNNIADAIVAKQNAPLSIAEYEAIVSHVKSETAKAHAKVLDSKGICTNNNQKPDDVRIEPILMGQGHAYWKLNISGKTDVLCQNVGKGNDTLTLDEEWSAIDVEGKEEIEKQACSLRGKRLTAPRTPNIA